MRGSCRQVFGSGCKTQQKNLLRGKFAYVQARAQRPSTKKAGRSRVSGFDPWTYRSAYLCLNQLHYTMLFTCM